MQEKLHDEVNKVLELPETKQRLAQIGADVLPMSQAQFAAFHDAENQRYAELVKKRGIRID